MIEVYAVDLLPSARGQSPVDSVPISLITARLNNIAVSVSLAMTQRAKALQTGYIAGTADGIVTINGKSASREIMLMDTQNRQWVRRSWSLNSGHYLLDELDPNAKYLVMVRDLPPTGTEQRYEPYCYDYVTPATDLAIAEQQALWESWQI